MSDAQEQDFDEVAADLALDAQKSYEEQQAEQEAFLNAVAEEEGEPPLETQCNIMGDYTVPLKAELNGELIDKLGAIESRLEVVQNEERGAYKISETADLASQLLADAIDDPTWNKDTFYAAYEQNTLDALGVMIERVFEALEQARERREGTADGFRGE